MILFRKIILLLLIPGFLMARQENSTLDSLSRQLKIASNDTLLMEAYYGLAFYYTEIRLDSAEYFSEKEIALTKKLGLKLWEAEALDLMGYILLQNYNYPEAVENFNAAKQIAEDVESEKNIWKPSHFLGGNNPATKRLYIIAGILHNMGHLYGSTGNVEQQTYNYREVLKISNNINEHSLSTAASMNLGSIYLDKNNLDSALVFEQDALEYAEISGDKTYQGHILTQIGSIYFRQKKYDFATKYITQAIRSSREQNNQRNLGFAYVSMAKIFRATGNSDSSIYYAKKSRDNFQSMSLASGLLAAYNSIVASYQLTNNTDSAFVYLQLARNLGDSLSTAEQEKLIQYQTLNFNNEIKLQKLEKERIQDRSRVRTYSMLAGIIIVLVTAVLLYRNNRQKQKTNNLLQITLSNLKAVQSQLIQSEKMASLGELTAGIAHEIQNPLNFVNNFSEVNNELIDEMETAIATGNKQDAIEISAYIKQNLEKINHHGKRAAAILKGMLQHSRTSSGQKELTDINALADEYLRLAYHGLRTRDTSFSATLKTDYDETIGDVNMVPQDIGRVILNLTANAFYAVDEKKKQQLENYEPIVGLSTRNIAGKIEIKVTDNGNGIPHNIINKIFQPFFTTKPTGQGTGLGLSLAYDIVKAHGGDLKAETKEGEGAEFIIQLPDK